MKQRILQRLYDLFIGEKNPLAGLCKLCDVGKPEVLKTVRNEWNGIEYVVQQEQVPYMDYPEWKLSLTGIRLPLYGRSSVNNAVGAVFMALVNYAGIETRYKKPGAREPYYLAKNRGISEEFQTPTIDAKSLSDANEKARRIIDAYLKHKEGIEKVLNEIDRVYPMTRQETERLLPKLREKFALGF